VGWSFLSLLCVVHVLSSLLLCWIGLLLGLPAMPPMTVAPQLLLLLLLLLLPEVSPSRALLSWELLPLLPLRLVNVLPPALHLSTGASANA
jgi:hypothetical protein